ncbi:MAG: EVE domain-containing protein [Actinomycetota bacterium]
MTNWLGVVSHNHVQRGVELGIVQTNHGAKAGLARMSPGEWFVYYSPKTAYPDGLPLKAFTAIGRIADDELFQVSERGFEPWRRRVSYETAREVPIADFGGALELTSVPNWGYQLRRGLIPLSDHDLDLVGTAMLGNSWPSS